jgi:hypothetical protein
MRRTHKNLIVEYLMQSEFGIDAFDLYDSQFPESKNSTFLEVKNSRLIFRIDPYPQNFDAYSVRYVQYGPSYPWEQPSISQSFTIDQVIERVEMWLALEVQPYFDDEEAPDLWQEYKKGVKYLKIDDIQTNDLTYFTPDDITRIRFAIEDLKALIPEKFNITQAQIELVNQKLDYLVDVAGRAPQTDWKGIAISTVLTIIVALSLDTARGNQLWELFMQVFRVVSMLPGSTQ